MAPAPRRSNFCSPFPRRLIFPRSTIRLVPARVCALALLAAIPLLLTGCGSFFSCEGKASCPVACVATATTTCPPAGGTGSTTADYAYVANSATNTTSIDAYNLGAGALTAVTGSPFSLGYSPTAMVVNPTNTFLYATSDAILNTTNPGVGYIYGYSIGTGGALSKLGSGNPLINENDAALAISPDGKWLFTLPSVAEFINEYPANASTGALGGAQATYSLASAPTGTISPISIAVAPSGEYFAAALGTGGANVFPFDTTTGVQPAGQIGAPINPGSSQNGIYALAFDSNNYLYCATTQGLTVFAVTSGVTLNAVNTTPYTLGTQPRSIAINSTSTFLYVGNEGDGTISAYSIGTGGVLTAVPGSPFTGPPTVNALAFDSTSKYLIASGYDASTGIQLFTIASTGALTSAGTAATGTSALIPGAIAATH